LAGLLCFMFGFGLVLHFAGFGAYGGFDAPDSLW
jgi:hypothetical protein